MEFSLCHLFEFVFGPESPSLYLWWLSPQQMSSGDQFNHIKEVSGLDFGPKTYLVSKQLHCTLWRWQTTSSWALHQVSQTFLLSVVLINRQFEFCYLNDSIDPPIYLFQMFMIFTFACTYVHGWGALSVELSVQRGILINMSMSTTNITIQYPDAGQDNLRIAASVYFSWLWIASSGSYSWT